MDENEAYTKVSGKRHYTVANVMRPEVYQTYMSALSSESLNSELQEFPNFSEKGDVALTLKNYPQFEGLSNKIHIHATQMKRKNDSIYKISGPMGLGLGVKTEGVHIAFAAGTGVLAFMDLVALIVRQSHFQRVYEDGLGDSFKLVMFHRRRDNEPIGHEFLKAANEKCDKFDYYLVKQIENGQLKVEGKELRESSPKSQRKRDHNESVFSDSKAQTLSG